jgi:hypothetical protein
MTQPVPVVSVIFSHVSCVRKLQPVEEVAASFVGRHGIAVDEQGRLCEKGKLRPRIAAFRIKNSDRGVKGS